MFCFSSNLYFTFLCNYIYVFAQQCPSVTNVLYFPTIMSLQNTCTFRRSTKWAYYPFNITRKDIFCSAFYFKWKYFVLNDHILSETICLFCSCVFFSNMFPKIKFTANFYSKVIFFIFCLRKYLLLYFAEFQLLMCHNSIVNISENLNKLNLLKICLQVTYQTDFCIPFYYGKKWYLIF